MARRLDKHNAKRSALNALGTALNRRSKSKCELCLKSASLQVVAIPPLPEQPSVDAAIFCCASCLPLTDNQKKLPESGELRFLETAVWSEVRPVQIAAVRALRRLANASDWAADALDSLYLDPEIEALIDS